MYSPLCQFTKCDNSNKQTKTWTSFDQKGIEKVFLMLNKMFSRYIFKNPVKPFLFFIFFCIIMRRKIIQSACPHPVQYPLFHTIFGSFDIWFGSFNTDNECTKPLHNASKNKQTKQCTVFFTKPNCLNFWCLCLSVSVSLYLSVRVGNQGLCCDHSSWLADFPQVHRKHQLAAFT